MEKDSVVVVCDSYYLSANNGEIPSRSPSPNRSLKGFNLFRVISQKIGRGIRQSKRDKSPNSDDDENSNSWLNSISRTPKKIQLRQDNAACECDYFYKSADGESITGDKNYTMNLRKEKNGKDEDYVGKKCLKFSTPCRHHHHHHHHHSSGSDTCSSNDDSSESNETERKGKRSHSSSNESSTSSSSSTAEFFKPANLTLCKGFKNLHLHSKSLSCFSASQMKETTERRESVSKEKKTKKSPQKILRQPATHTYVRGISGLSTVKVSLINNGACYNNQYSRG